MTIDILFHQYIELKKHKWAKHTYVTNLSSYNNHIFPYIGHKDINTLNFIDYQKLANILLERSLSPKTVKNIMLIVTGIVHFAQKVDLYDGKDYVTFVELPSFDNKQYFTSSVDVQIRYIKAILNFQEPVYKDIFLFLLHGRRLNEVLDLDWEFIDLQERVMYLPSARNKSRKNLIFELTSKQLAVLNAVKPSLRNGNVFLNPATGKKYKDIRKAWQRLLDGANLDKIRIHDIRHLIGTYLINELNIPIEHVSHLLGHSSIQVTQRYVNLKPANAKNAMDSLFESL